MKFGDRLWWGPIEVVVLYRADHGNFACVDRDGTKHILAERQLDASRAQRKQQFTRKVLYKDGQLMFEMKQHCRFPPELSVATFTWEEEV